MNAYVVCMDSYRTRDAQMFETSSFSDEELLKIDPFSKEMEQYWFDAEFTPYIGVFNAETEKEACEMAAKMYRYDVRILFATKIEIGGLSK